MNWALTFVRVTVFGAALSLCLPPSAFSRPPAFAGAGFRPAKAGRSDGIYGMLIA